MSITTRLTTSLAGTCLLLLATVFSNSAYAVGIPGSDVPESGSPSMLHSIKVRANRGGWTINATKGNADFQLSDGTSIYAGTGGKYNLDVEFNRNTGAFIGGTLEITGAIEGLEIFSKNTTLVTADIIDYDFDDVFNNQLIGFATDNMLCDAGLGFSCTSSESIWLLLDSPFSGDTTSRFKNSGTAITTLPLPAAVWLFGSGLVFMAATGRRRSAGSKKS